MNKLKKLFSPSALATTIATGLLFLSATKALAGWYQVSTNNDPNVVLQQCPNGYCSAYCNPWGSTVYWCCDPNYRYISCPNVSDGTLATCSSESQPQGLCFTSP